MMASVDGRFWMVDWRFLLPALVLFAGCLPHSCGGPGSQALLPADSLSRQAAQAVPVDTLAPVWQYDGGAAHPLRFPRTALFLPGADSTGTDSTGAARLAVSDAEREQVLLFSEDGQLADSVASAQFAAPYLIGRRGDTLVVLSPRARRVSFVASGRDGAPSGPHHGYSVVRSTTLALPPVDEAPLLWGLSAGGALFAKTIDADEQTILTRHDLASGQVTARRALPGPRWRHAGPLRWWRDSLASLSGYRPILHRLPPSLAARDTLRLRGFDSPMFPRSRRYAEGDVHQPPLLMPDAAAAGRFLFVLNLRPGRLHIDVFGPGGRLVRRLTAPASTRNGDVYPRALAARRLPGGAYALAVALTDPQPAVRLYRWRPAEGVESPLADGWHRDGGGTAEHVRPRRRGATPPPKPLPLIEPPHPIQRTRICSSMHACHG